MKLFIARVFILMSTHPFESLFGLPLALFFGWYVLALAGLFYPALILTLASLVGLAALYILSKKPAFCHLTTILLSTFLVFIAVIALTSHPVEIVAEGRDQGTFATAALLLNQFHSFSFALPEAIPFFTLYGEGKALNFPGLAYTTDGTLIPEFPLGYTIWLAGFVSLFGILGFSLANGILYLLSGMLLYVLLKRVIPLFWSFVGTLVAMGGFLPVWFLSFTLSENLALFLFLLTIESVLRFRISKDSITLFLALTSAFALALTRIEGWAILVLVFLILTLRKSKREWLTTYFFQKPLLGITWLIAFFSISIGTFLLNLPYYKAIIKALYKTADQNQTLQAISQDAFPLYQVLWEYGIFLPLLLGILSCLYFWKSRRIMLLIPFFLALPTLPYLLLPHITPDAPWMLRRFLFSLYPALFISTLWATSLLIQRLQIQKSGRVWGSLFILLVGCQVPVITRYIGTAYPQTLLPQVENITHYSTPQDLILVDRTVTGDNFMMPSRILSTVFNRPAVYFFNPTDFAKIETAHYERVLLLVPTERISFYEESLGKSLIPVTEQTFVNDHSFRTLSLGENNLPSKNIIRTQISLLEIR